VPRARGKKGPAEAEGPSKAWLDSYADAMTLLLAFFILLYASSIIDEDLFLDFKIGVAQALGNPSPVIDGGIGVLDSGNGVTSLIAAASTVEEDGSSGDAPNIDEDEVNEGMEAEQSASEALEEILEGDRDATRENAATIVEALEEIIEEVGAAPYVDVVDDPRGIILRFDSQVLFRSGDAKVLPDGVIVLTSVVDVLKGLDNLLVVEGHTDNVPTNGTRWPTNWELSTARATNVLRFLSEVEGVPAVRLSAAGYADTRPRTANDTAEGRSENRRVEVVILVQPFLEDVVPADGADIPRAADFGAEVENPAGPRIIPDNLLDLSPEPVLSEG